jgi:hypothetical protein
VCPSEKNTGREREREREKNGEEIQVAGIKMANL